MACAGCGASSLITKMAVVSIVRVRQERVAGGYDLGHLQRSTGPSSVLCTPGPGSYGPWTSVRAGTGSTRIIG